RSRTSPRSDRRSRSGLRALPTEARGERPSSGPGSAPPRPRTPRADSEAGGTRKRGYDRRTSRSSIETRPEKQGRISRPRLARRVAHALGSGSLTITAGAGAGKTTLLEEALADSPSDVA